MAIIHSIERRGEPRREVNLKLQVWGVDTLGSRFVQAAQARDISLRGALISGLDAELRSGDVIGVLFEGRKARYRVVWVRQSGGATQKIQAAVQRLEPDECPWRELVEEHAEASVIPPVR
jgi:hypothetical protein